MFTATALTHAVEAFWLVGLTIELVRERAARRALIARLAIEARLPPLSAPAFVPAARQRVF